MHRRTLARLTSFVGAACFVVAARPAAAQSDMPRTSVGAGYSYLYEAGTGGGPSNTYDKGWLVSVAQRLGSTRFAVVGEVGVNTRVGPVGETQRLWGLLGGIRFPLVRLGRASTFAQALAGLESFREPGFDEQGPAFQPGVGIDLRLLGPIALRVHADFRVATEGGATFKEGRGVVGIAWNLR